MQRKGEFLKNAFIAIGIVAVYAILAFIMKPVYYMNDDVTIRSILSGAFTGSPDGHAIYMEYPLTGVLAFFYKIMPVIPWFDVFMSGVLLYCIYSITALSRKLKPVAFGIAMLISVCIFWDTMWYMHYTVAAALVAGTGICTYVLSKKKMNSAVLMLFAFMIRKQIFFLALPFFGAAILYDFLFGNERDEDEDRDEGRRDRRGFGKRGREDRRSPISKAFAAVIFMAVGVLIFFCMRSGMYGDEWKSYSSYNDARTKLYDYTGFPSMSKESPAVKELDIPDETKTILISYDTMLDSGIGEETFNTVYEAMPDEKPGLKEAFKQYINYIRYDRYPLRMGVMALYGLVILGFFIHKKWRGLLPVLCVLLGRSAIWVVLIMNGRFPERINLSLLVLEGMFLFGILLKLISYPDMGILALGEKMVLTGLGIAFLIINVMFTNTRLSTAHEAQKKWDVLKEYFAENEDNRYLLDVYPMVSFGETLYKKGPENAMLLGGWISESPVAEKKLAEMGEGDASDVLISNDNVYFVTGGSSDISEFDRFFKSRYENAEMTLTDTVDCGDGKVFAVYSVERRNNGKVGN